MKIIRNVRHVGVDGIISVHGYRAMAEFRTRPYIKEEFLAVNGATLPAPWAFDTHDPSAVTAPTNTYLADARWGQYRLRASADAHDEGAQISFGDQLMIPAEVGLVFETHIIPVAVPAAASDVFWIGLSSNHTNAEDAISGIATRVGFTAAANANLLVDTDDATTDNTDFDTTVDLVAATRIGLRIELRQLDEVVFWTSNATAGSAENWVRRHTASIAALAANTLWQPLFVVNKVIAGTASIGFDIEHCDVYHDDDR